MKGWLLQENKCPGLFPNPSETNLLTPVRYITLLLFFPIQWIQRLGWHSSHLWSYDSRCLWMLQHWTWQRHISQSHTATPMTCLFIILFIVEVNWSNNTENFNYQISIFSSILFIFLWFPSSLLSLVFKNTFSFIFSGQRINHSIRWY